MVMDGAQMHDTDGADAAPPEQPKRRQKRRPAPRTLAADPVRVPRFADLGAMPTEDPLAMNAWIHRSLGVAAAQVVADPELTEGQRRSQLCDIAGRMSALTPQSRIFGAEGVIRGEASGLNQGHGPEMERVSDVQADAIDPATGRTKARRGRPRKRGIG